MKTRAPLGPARPSDAPLVRDAKPASVAQPTRSTAERDAFLPGASALEELKSDAKLALQAAYYQAQAKQAKAAVFADPSLPVPEDRGGITVETYNILHGGKHLDAVEQHLQGTRPDVVCLQECSVESARRLGATLGMHVVVSGEGKAILSRYPVVDAEHRDYEVPFAQQWAAADAANEAEPLIERGALRATVQVGDRKVDILDTHLSLRDPGLNAANVEQLAAYVEQRRSAGHTVVAAGDFNLNFATVAGGVADPAGTFTTPTDTPQEFQDRYGRPETNAADPRVRRAAQSLYAQLQGHWEGSDRQVILGDEKLRPEQAQALLASGSIPRGSARERELLSVLDGVSHFGARKRFDNVFSSRDVEVTRASIALDRTEQASDHSPVRVELRWK